MSIRTLYDKLWERHWITDFADGSSLIYIDLHLLHEVTSPQGFANLERLKRPVWRPRGAVATPDHNVPTAARRLGLAGFRDPIARRQVARLEENCERHGIPLFGLADKRQGIVHVIGPEQGLTLPGMTVVCGDSHTATHGALAALAYGIGSSEVEHVLATQTLRTRKMANMAVEINGQLPPGTSSKDLALHLIGCIGTAGGAGHAIEFRGSTIRALSMEARMTLCNMSIEAGARAGLIACDETTRRYVEGRPFAPSGALWDAAVENWSDLKSDDDAPFDRVVRIDAAEVAPSVSWGTSPEMVVPITARIPLLSEAHDEVQRADWQRALAYMGLEAGQPVRGIEIDKVFIGSCTNARIEDLRAAAGVIRGRKVHPRVRQAMVVPGSGLVAEQAEREGLDQVFLAAGFEWRAPGCSMCLGMNPDHLEPGERCASTSNRNFEGRQGRGGRTHLLSPVMAVAAAIAGALTDVRES